MQLFRPLSILSLGLAVTLASACTEDTPVAPSAHPIVALTAAPVATPPPRAIATPDIQPTPEVALPGTKADPTPPAIPTPSPTPVGHQPSAEPSPSDYTKTGAPGDLAVSGPAYFVLATKPDPLGVEDLLFTRVGQLQLVKDATGALPLFRLKHAELGFHVVGLARAGAPAGSAPDESDGPAAGMLGTRWASEALQAAGLAIDAERNAGADTQLGFDYTGRLQIGGKDPRAADGGALGAYVALASFERPQSLVAQPGFAEVYKYAEAAGAIRLGVAVTGAGRTLGNANLILTGTLEKEAN